MADNEKRLRVSVDVSQLRSVGRDVENMQRRIVENNNDIIRQQNDALNQLREQLNLLGQQNSEKGSAYSTTGRRGTRDYSTHTKEKKKATRSGHFG